MLETWLLDTVAMEGGPVPVIGHSRGGQEGRVLAVRHPEAVSLLVTLGAPLQVLYPPHLVVRAPVAALPVRPLGPAHPTGPVRPPPLRGRPHHALPGGGPVRVRLLPQRRLHGLAGQPRPGAPSPSRSTAPTSASPPRSPPSGQSPPPSPAWTARHAARARHVHARPPRERAAQPPLAHGGELGGLPAPPPAVRAGRCSTSGCGPGNITCDLADRVAPGPVVGLDASAEVVAGGHRRGRTSGATANVEFRDRRRLRPRRSTTTPSTSSTPTRSSST